MDSLYTPTNVATNYDQRFFAWQEDGSGRSARLILPLLRDNVDLGSVVDLGCGTGGWLAAWQALGVADVLGVDGPYVADGQLLIAPERFRRQDLTQHWSAGRSFDLVESLEVAEHLPRSSAEPFVDALCSLGDVIVFSAAQPGQGGDAHVNERPLRYWQRLFEARGFRTFDPIRPRICDDVRIDAWYRHNILLFANESGAGRLSSAFLASECTGTPPVASHGDWLWALRRALLRPMPGRVVTRISKASYALKSAARTRRSRA